MKLSEFLTLPTPHNIEFDEGQNLLREIAQNDLPTLSEEQAHQLEDYLSVNLLHECVPLELVVEIKAKLEQLQRSI